MKNIKKYTNKTNFILVTLSVPQTASGITNIQQIIINIEKILAIRENKDGSTIYYCDHCISVKNSYKSLIDELKQYKEFSRFTEIIGFNERGVLIPYKLNIDLSQIYYAYYIPGTRLDNPCYKYYIYFKPDKTYDILLYTYTDLSNLNN